MLSTSGTPGPDPSTLDNEVQFGNYENDTIVPNSQEVAGMELTIHYPSSENSLLQIWICPLNFYLVFLRV